MPRPQKCRRICAMPESTDFCPIGSKRQEETVILQIDEYESIRLIDLLGMTQESCAVQMGVSRTTVTGIYENARKKIANALVNGKRLVIQGGNIQMCGGQRKCGRCRQQEK